MSKTGRKTDRLGAGVSREDKALVRGIDTRALAEAKAVEREYGKRAAILRGRHNGTVVRTTNPGKWEGRI